MDNRRFKTALAIGLAGWCAGQAAAQQVGDVLPMEEVFKRKYTATRIERADLTIDGKLDEALWQSAGEWSEPFIQKRPVERAVSKYETRAKILYDDKQIYIGIVCYDDQPELIHRYVSNRDDRKGDWVQVSFDTYHDFRVATQFALGAGGTHTDMTLTDDKIETTSWNAVWKGKTHIDIEGKRWTAEFSIPFSQLSYRAQSDEDVWGLHIMRNIDRESESVELSFAPPQTSNIVYAFGELHGMRNLPTTHQLELIPYVSGKHLREPKIEGSPYQTGSDWQGGAGLDAKARLGDYTLNLTVNPDFGQVEQDPSVMNLNTNETFYEEKRSFFLEGNHVFNFASTSDKMFYTRRIGAMPSYSPTIDNQGSFAESPSNVPIIGALKGVGTNRRGVTIGLMESITARQSINQMQQGQESKVITEPLTNFTALRLQKNWDGHTFLGGMLTSVNRALGAEHLRKSLVKDAITAGIDFSKYSKDRLYYVDAKAMFSTLHGSAEAITRKQRNAVHFYQRTSAADYLGVDESRTSLNGGGGYVELGRKGNAKWQVSDRLSYYSPGFDLNDIGYLARADWMDNLFDISFNQNTPWSIFRSTAIKYTMEHQWDAHGNNKLGSYRLRWDATLRNRWGWWITQTFRMNRHDDRILRGGPDLRLPSAHWNSFGIFSDQSRPFYVAFDYISNRNMDGSKFEYNLKPSITYQAGNHLLLEAAFQFYTDRNDWQYAGTLQPAEAGESPAYLVGRMFQRTKGLTFRAQVNVTPDISVQFYGAPFSSNARYSQFQAAANTLSDVRSERLRPLTPSEQQRMGNPDFSFNEFRSNLVARWEYRPGSTLYLVWEHSMSNRDKQYRAGWGNNLDHMFGLPATNVFMVKMNYYFSL